VYGAGDSDEAGYLPVSILGCPLSQASCISTSILLRLLVGFADLACHCCQRSTFDTLGIAESDGRARVRWSSAVVDSVGPAGICTVSRHDS
jgi:hypothetical protein